MILVFYSTEGTKRKENSNEMASKYYRNRLSKTMYKKPGIFVIMIDLHGIAEYCVAELGNNFLIIFPGQLLNICNIDLSDNSNLFWGSLKRKVVISDLFFLISGVFIRASIFSLYSSSCQFAFFAFDFF